MCSARSLQLSPASLCPLTPFAIKKEGVKWGGLHLSAFAFQQATAPPGLGLFSSLSAAGRLQGKGKKMRVQKVDFALGLISRAVRPSLSAGAGLVEGQK